MKFQILSLVPLALMGACTDPNLDTDGDGITDVDEIEMGLDPESSDGDNDGLNDGDEIAAGTDYNKADSDGDGMNDGDEVLYGKDPLDPEVGPYNGDWPYQTATIKDGIVEAKKTGKTVTVGKRLPRWNMVAHNGDQIDLYDFAGHGKKVFVDVSAEWCPPCRQMAADIEAGTNGMAPLTEAIENGDVYWITLMGENMNYEPPTRPTAKAWYDDFPSPNIPVLADKEQESVDFILSETGSWPTVVVLNQNMTVLDVFAGIDPGMFDYLPTPGETESEDE